MGKNQLQLIKLGISQSKSKTITPEERIGLNKISKKSRIDSKKKSCLYCEKEFDGFCNSHSIPVFVLKNIAIDGKVYSSYKLVSYNFHDDEIGINKTNTFQRICRRCDSIIFKDYENPQNYNLTPTAQMINQIAMKNYLRMIDKKYFEMALFDNVLDENPSSLVDVSFEQNLIRMDLNEYLEEFISARMASFENRYKSFRLVYYEKLDYVVPLAFQGLITLISDLKGNLVNDIYNPDSNYKMQNLHVVVMPLKYQTVIMMFVNKKSKRYNEFFKQFGNLDKEDKLSVINYMIFSNSEDFILSKTIKNEVLNNVNLKKISEMMSRIDTTYEVKNPLKYMIQMYDMEKRHGIPNFLSNEYKIR